jgi:uncharacterized radical SAM superfamily Fe-S cluster-containing enzyme
MTDTTTVCATCLEVVPAEVLVGDDGVMLVTRCPTHGESSALIERDPKLYADMHHPTSKRIHDSINTVILNATDRCNQVCRHCYHMPGDEPDPLIEELVARAEASPCPNVILMGAEPTVRNDLSQLLNAMPKPTGMYTNAINLSDKKFLNKLLAADIEFFCVSLHTESYNDNDAIWQKKLQAMENLRTSHAHVHHLAFSMSHPDDIVEVFKTCKEFWDMGDHHRIRIPSDIGRCGNESFFISDFMPKLLDEAVKNGWTVRRMYDDDTPYHVNLMIDDKWFRIIRWPSIEEVDLGELQGPPFCQFDDEVGEVNFVHGALVAAEKKIRRGRK